MTNTPRPPAFPDILPALESAARSIRSRDFNLGTALLDQACGLLGTATLDGADRMILGKVSRRLGRASREAAFSSPLLLRLESIAGIR